MFYVSELKKMTIQQLDPIARKHGISRVHSMRKADLIRTLILKLEKAGELASEQNEIPSGLEQFALSSNRVVIPEVPQIPTEPVSAQTSDAASTPIPAETSNPVSTTIPAETSNPVSSKESASTTVSNSVSPVVSEESNKTPVSSEPKAVSPEPPIPQPSSLTKSNLSRVFTERASTSLKKTEASLAKIAAAQQENISLLYSTPSKPNDLSYLPDAHSDIPEDSFVLDMIDPYWLHATWCLRRKTIDRAKTILGQYWYTAKPMLRLTVLSDGDAGTGGRFRLLRDILIHGHVNHWFIPVQNPPTTFLAEIGYYCPVQKKFYGLLKSNVISTPQARSALRYEKSAEVAWMTVCGLQPAKLPSWSPKNHNLYKRWADKTNQTLASDSSALKVETPEVSQDELPLRVTTELVLYGSTTPDSQVTMDDEWVAVQPDGTFMMRLQVPDQGRQMININSTNHNGSRKMVLTMERTTQMLTPQNLQEPEQEE